MLILTVYSWHHYLKGNLLKGKRNRRLDTLLARLFDALEHFQYCHDRQELGFEGKDLVSLRLAKMESDARREQEELLDLYKRALGMMV